MFKNKQFYNEHITKAIVSFGLLFTNLVILRRNESNEIVQKMRVPLSHAPKEKFIARILEAPNLEDGRAPFEITLPRMGFEIIGFNYDPTRNLQNALPVRSQTENGVARGTYISSPYNMEVRLSIYAKNMSDSFQIVEQILPYFRPDFNITIDELPGIGVKRDIQFILQSANFDMEYEGPMADRRMVVWDLSFLVRMNFFGYVGNTAQIKKVITNLYSSSTAEWTEGVGVNLESSVGPTDTPDDFEITDIITELFPDDI